MTHRPSSRERYRTFVDDYKHSRLRDGEPAKADDQGAQAGPLAGGKRREYLREYLRWLRPHRFQLAGVFALAIVVAGMEMIEPLFMRFIVDRVLLNAGLDPAARLSRLHTAGALFVGVIVMANLAKVLNSGSAVLPLLSRVFVVQNHLFYQ